MAVIDGRMLMHSGLSVDMAFCPEASSSLNCHSISSAELISISTAGNNDSNPQSAGPNRNSGRPQSCDADVTVNRLAQLVRLC